MPRPPKKIHKNSITGEEGINLIQRIVLRMGFVWYPTGGVEGGIDGIIEIRNSETGEITNSIVQVQSKATKNPFQAETDEEFDYLCDARDLDYWMRGNAPVILVVSQPAKQESYWISIKDYFADPAVRQTRKIRFDKRLHKFDPSCKEALAALALPTDSGIYFTPPPKAEHLYSNLIKVDSFFPTIYVARTECRMAQDVWNALRSNDEQIGSEWVLKNKSILSFHDLREYPWNRVCEAVEDFDSDEWAYSQDPDQRKEFVWLLNQCLKELTWKRGLKQEKTKGYFFVRPTPDLRLQEQIYKSHLQMTSREVFRHYLYENAKGKFSYYRHSAFYGQFRLHDEQWFLEVEPTYHFTVDGYRLCSPPLTQALLKGIKVLEKNPALLGQILMWSSLLQKRGGLFGSDYSFLELGQLQAFDVDFGVEDGLWRQKEAEVPGSLNQSGLFGL